MNAGWRADHCFAHGHGFHDLDVRAGRNDQGSHHDGCPYVRGPDVSNEVFHLNAGLREIQPDAVLITIEIILMPRSRDDVQSWIKRLKMWPYVTQEEIHRQHIRPMRERTDE